LRAEPRPVPTRRSPPPRTSTGSPSTAAPSAWVRSRSPQCVEACPIPDCIVVDPQHVEAPEALLARYTTLHLNWRRLRSASRCGRRAGHRSLGRSPFGRMDRSDRQSGDRVCGPEP